MFFTLATAKTDANASLFTSKDYSLSLPEEEWEAFKVKDKQEISLALKTKLGDTSLTVREFESKKTLKENVSTWLKDYRSYGFAVTQSRPVKLGPETYGFQVKALHKKSGKIFNQYMSIKNEKLLILTCQSDKKNKDFDQCEKSLNSFSWKKSL